MNGRNVTLDVKYDNYDITADIESFITDISFTDSIDQADDISISIGDREKRWVNTWSPKKGAGIEVDLNISSDWATTTSQKRKLGYFEIDDLSTSGPPTKVTIKGTSIPQSSSLKGEQKSRSWAKTTLKKVTTDIAKKHNMRLYFSVQENPSYDRMDQESETDLAFLMRICKDAGCALKIASKTISILDEYKLENSSSVGTIKRTDPLVMSWEGSDTLSSAYKSCRVSYTSSKTKKTYNYTFTPSHPPKTNRVLVVEESVSSQSEAMKLAKSKLRAENKDTTTFSIKLAGFVNYYAGQTIYIKEFGSFDGKYLIKSVSGTIGSASETTLELRKCLVGY